MEPYLGEIRTFAFGKIPQGWMPCNGQTLQVMQNQALFSLLGTYYGGDGRNTFNLPDLRGVAMLGWGVYHGPSTINYIIGQKGGTETAPLDITQIPAHNHTVNTVNSPGNNALNNTDDYLAQLATFTAGPTSQLNAVFGYVPPVNPTPPLINLQTDTILPAGGSAAHENRMPYLPLNICICVTGGYYPPRD